MSARKWFWFCWLWIQVGMCEEAIFSFFKRERRSHQSDDVLGGDEQGDQQTAGVCESPGLGDLGVRGERVDNETKQGDEQRDVGDQHDVLLRKDTP